MNILEVPRWINASVQEQLIQLTVTEIEARALQHYKQWCLRASDSVGLTNTARKGYKQLANKIQAIMDLRGDYTNGKAPRTGSNGAISSGSAVATETTMAGNTKNT